MNEHQFKGTYNLGYGDAMYEHHKNRKTTWMITIALILITAVVAFWGGRISMKNKVSSEYEAGFDAGVREGTTQWEEWK